MLETDPDVIARYLEDAAHYPGGHARAVARPSTFAEVAQVVREASRVLAVGAQSSLTGGATPSGDVVLSTERLQGIRMSSSTVTVEAGVTLERLQQELAGHGRWLPPVPTFLGATAGGAVSTNAAGAATFKYGTMRDWVEAVTIVLASGDVLTIARGQVQASADGVFALDTAGGTIAFDAPRVRMPDVPKCSAGYFSRPGMDLVDLFVGAEGTLGVIVNATFRTERRPAGVAWAFVPVPDEARAILLVDALRRAALDVAAIEHIDRRTLQIMREDGVGERLHVAVPASADVVLLVQIEMRVDASDDTVWDELNNLLEEHGVVDATEIVLPGDGARRAALAEFRESAPASVNRRVALAKQADSRIHKTAGDSVVPFDRFGEMMKTCRRLFAERGVDLAVWGHISDGNVHPNVVPRSYRDVEEGKAILLELGREVVAMGGSPLAEHGVGRSLLKQQLLRLMYGGEGIESMRRVKLGLDPEWKLASGVLFDRVVSE